MGNKNKKFKILIVDDNPKNIQLAANILQKEGYQMAFAQNGKSALSQAQSNRCCL
jgi:CheY-like chemotaxis protein